MEHFFKKFLPYAFLILLYGCREAKRFELLPPERTGIQFANIITERDTLNILDMEFVYNGGGVAVGDLNADGYQDLCFTGNQVGNKLYLNRGDFRFQDVTAIAGVQKTSPHQWSSGVNILDLNLDGRLDIYVCNTINPDPEQRRNLLFINQGNNSQGIPTFQEKAAEYGLNDSGHSSNAQFFDADNDGDLDIFLSINFIDHQYPNQFKTRIYDGSEPTRDRLLLNNWSDSLHHPVFKDVSLAAGITLEGYSHSALTFDCNGDGRQDIYVANDYQSNDIFFINKSSPAEKEPHFVNQIAHIFKHQSMSSMGSDVADINADGRPDVFVTEMQPYYNKRKKLFQGGSSYQRYIFTEHYKYEYQYTRNVLQICIGNDPETQLPLFADIGMYSGVHETDWSWSSIFGDFDLDGLTDLYVANGFPKDVTDHDFADFRKSIASTVTPKSDLYAMIPEVKSPNFLFKNQGDLTFKNKAQEWGLAIRSFSNGAAFADLDNDGDLDLITNNLDDPAFIFENKTIGAKRPKKTPNFLTVKLKGPAKNPDAFGSTVQVFTKGRQQKLWMMSARGYLSAPENAACFGLGQTTMADSVVVTWPDQSRSLLRHVKANQVLWVKYGEQSVPAYAPRTTLPVFENLSGQFGLDFQLLENDYIDFNFQRTSPHKVSQYGAALTVGDVDGDGLFDLFIGGSSRYHALLLMQQPDGFFKKNEVDFKSELVNKQEDTGSLLFDADNDGDLDLYIVRGSGQWPPNDSLYQDMLCLNDGKGNFQPSLSALPKITANGSCVKAADYDQDGDLDLFVGSRVLPKQYPKPDRCFLLKNDGNAHFQDATPASLQTPGLVSDALWTDYNADGWPDLMLACEWSPLLFFKNEKGHLTPATEIALSQAGWWNSLAAADLDNDEDLDYIAGNFGENLYFRCSGKEPLRIYAKDFDGNGDTDPFISCYWPDSLGKRHEYLYHPREDVIKQWPGFRKKYQKFGEYGEATVQDIFNQQDLQGALILQANWMKTSILENLGNGQFRLLELPAEAQMAPVYGILPYDVNQDGLLDILLTGNDFGVELQQGRADAFAGLVLQNKGSCQFEPLDMERSHFIVRKDARALVSIPSATGKELIIASQSADYLRVFALRPPAFATATSAPGINAFYPLTSQETKAIFYLRNGSRRIEEFLWGTSFLSQKGRYVVFNPAIERVELYGPGNRLTRRLNRNAGGVQ